MKKKPVITIDGPAGAGKSTISKLLAKRLSFVYLDTGALYRAMAYRLMSKGYSGKEDDVTKLCGNMTVELNDRGGQLRVIVDGEDLTEKIRTEEIGLLASRISAIPLVREVLLSVQRNVGATGRVVAEGRDMGTVVFPDAMIKFFLDASVKVRVSRRYLELIAKGESPSLKDVEDDLLLRDQQDRERTIAPLKVPPDAIFVDTTDKNISAVVDAMMTFIGNIYDRQ